MGGPRTPGQRAGLTREVVLSTAHQLLLERGLGGLTMRALARRLDVAPNALYTYVENKTALVDDLLDQVLAAVEAPAGDDVDPRAGLSLIMTSTFTVLLKHPDLVPLFLARQGARGPNARHLGDVMFALLRQAGVTGAPAGEARRVLIVYTIGFAAFAAPTPVEPGTGGPLSVEEISDNFSSGLNWLLAGILTPPAR